MYMRLGTIVSKYVPVLLLLLVLPGCSVKKNRKLLEFFFDGVPEPGVTERQNSGTEKKPAGRKRRPAAAKAFVKIESRHPDYYKNICNNCHNRSASNFLKTDKKELCFTCHKPEAFTGPFVHGPVAVKQCLACHLPHESKYDHLLRAKIDALCDQCHNQERVETPDPCDRGKVCTDCHAAHVADNKYFIKSEVRPGANGGGQ